MKKSVILGLCMAVFIIIILFILLPHRHPVSDSPKETEDSSSSLFSAAAEWKGTNGEVIRTLYIDASKVYAAAGFDGLIVFDTNLNRLGGFVTNNPLFDIVIKTIASNKYAVATMGSYMGKGGIILLNVTDPKNIFATNVFEDDEVSGNVFSSGLSKTGGNGEIGETLYTTDFKKGFQSYSVDWTNLTISAGKSIVLTDNAPVDLAVYKTNAYIAEKEDGVFVLDIPGSKILKQMKSSISYANALSLIGSTLAVADKMCGILFYDISNPEKIISAGNYDTPGDAYDVLMISNDIYIADGINGVLMVRRTQPDSFTMLKQFHEGLIAYRVYYSPSGNIYAVFRKRRY